MEFVQHIVTVLAYVVVMIAVLLAIVEVTLISTSSSFGEMVRLSSRPQIWTSNTADNVSRNRNYHLIIDKIDGLLVDITKKIDSHASDLQMKKSMMILKTSLYEQKCKGEDCQNYYTPVQSCYNGNDSYNMKVFQQEDRSSKVNRMDFVNKYLTHEGCPNDDDSLDSNPFGEYDIYDNLVFKEKGIKEETFDIHDTRNDEIIGIRRLFFKSKDGTCSGEVTDQFSSIPLNQCVGPFGPPKPWGTLKLISIPGTSEA